MLFLKLALTLGLLQFLRVANGELRCGQTECDLHGYDNAYCCGDGGIFCCRSYNLVHIWWFWFIFVLFMVLLGICTTLLCIRHRRRRAAILYHVQPNTPGVIVATHQSNISQVSAPVPQQYQYGRIPSVPKGYGTNGPPAPSAPFSGYPPPYAPKNGY